MGENRRVQTVLGVDFGTQSARAVLVNTQNGQVLASHRVEYTKPEPTKPEIDCPENLPSAADYETALYEVLEHAVPEQWKESVAGICVDATSLTLVALAEDGCPVSELPEFRHDPHARVKLWKYHRAQEKAEEALKLARELKEPFLKRSCDFISCEWTLPKLLEIRDEAPEIYKKIDVVLDLCEFLTYRLTGEVIRSMGSMCYKGLWFPDLGFPSRGFLDDLRPGFYEEYCRMLRGEVRKPGEMAGVLLPELCQRMSLPEGIPVAAGLLDGHTSLAVLGAFKPGDASLVVGTSNVLTVQCTQLREVKDVCGIAQDGMVAGACGIDAGQSGTGNMLGWYLEHMADWRVHQEAKDRNVSEHQLLAERIRNPWQNKVVAADWWSGSRNAPCDLNLQGGMLGLTMDTRTEDIYLALLQSIACGTRAILDSLAEQGIEVCRILAAGGIAEKNPLLMQEYANLMNRTVLVGRIKEGPAVGAAIYSAVAAGLFKNLSEAYENMGVREFTVYEPDQIHREAYDTLYLKNLTLRNCLISLKGNI